MGYESFLSGDQLRAGFLSSLMPRPCTPMRSLSAFCMRQSSRSWSGLYMGGSLPQCSGPRQEEKPGPTSSPGQVPAVRPVPVMRAQMAAPDAAPVPPVAVEAGTTEITVTVTGDAILEKPMR